MPFSPHIYTKLLQAQIPKAQKDSQVISVFLCFWDLSKQNLHVNMLMKLTQGQIPNVQKDSEVICVLLRFLDLSKQKLQVNMLMKLT